VQHRELWDRHYNKGCSSWDVVAGSSSIWEPEMPMVNAAQVVSRLLFPPQSFQDGGGPGRSTDRRFCGEDQVAAL